MRVSRMVRSFSRNYLFGVRAPERFLINRRLRTTRTRASIRFLLCPAVRLSKRTRRLLIRRQSSHPVIWRKKFEAWKRENNLKKALHQKVLFYFSFLPGIFKFKSQVLPTVATEAAFCCLVILSLSFSPSPKKQNHQAYQAVSSITKTLLSVREV